MSHNTTGGDGGGIYTNGDLTMTDSNISHNDALWGGGGVAAIYTQMPGDKIPDVHLERVTIDNNVGHSDAGGIFNLGGVIALTNVTLSGNWGYSRGGAMLTGTFQGTPAGAGDVTIYASTIANNRTAPGQGGGIANYAWGSHGPTTTSVSSTIFANNDGGNCAIGGFAVFQSLDYNISDDASCNLSQHADLVSTDPKLNPLTMNAPGRVKTHALQTGSPADNLSTGGCGSPVDARGVARGLPCDTGAYEGTVEPFKANLATAVVAVNATCRAGHRVRGDGLPERWRVPHDQRTQSRCNLVEAGKLLGSPQSAHDGGGSAGHPGCRSSAASAPDVYAHACGAAFLLQSDESGGLQGCGMHVEVLGGRARPLRVGVACYRVMHDGR